MMADVFTKTTMFGKMTQAFQLQRQVKKMQKIFLLNLTKNSKFQFIFFDYQIFLANYANQIIIQL